MRRLTDTEISGVGGAADDIFVLGVTITQVEAGMALLRVAGAVGTAFGAGYAIGTVLNSTYQTISGKPLGKDLYDKFGGSS